MFTIRRFVKFSLLSGVVAGTAVSFTKNQYDIDAIGVVRLGRAATTVLKIALLYKNSLYVKGLDPESPEYIELRSQVHKCAAEKLLNLCCSNKGVYIKVGQHIGALDYLVPKEYVDTMKVLHSHAPSSNLDDIYKVVREDLKEDPSKIFASMDPNPLGTASLAQVHKAHLMDGTVVAVKVQHPSVRGNSKVDMKTMEILVRLVSWTFPEFQFDWLVNETKRNIPIELDFTQEGRNAEKVKKMFRKFPWLKVPSVHWNLTTSRVLTMDFVEGGQVNDLEYIEQNRIDPYEVSSKLGKLYSQMIFIKGFVHSDPHPGNILVQKNPVGNVDIILLDHGLYATLSSDIRCEYSKLWLSIFNMDKEGMRKHCEKLGVGELYGLFACMVTGRTWDAIQSGIEKTQFSKKEKAMFQKEIPGLLPQINNVLSKVNRQMLLVLKTNDLMRGIEHTLKTESQMTSFFVMSRCCIQSVYEEKLKECKTTLSQFQLLLHREWQILKLNVYYSYLRSLRLIGWIYTLLPANNTPEVQV